MNKREILKIKLLVTIALVATFIGCTKNDNANILPTVTVRHTIIGTVFNTGELSNVTVSLGGDSTATVNTAEDGTYRFNDIKPGKYTISVTLTGIYSLPKSLDLSDKENSTISTADIALVMRNEPTPIVAATGGTVTCQIPLSEMSIVANINADKLAEDRDITITPIYANVDIKPNADIPLLTLECLPDAQQFTSAITIATDNPATPIVVKNLTLKTRAGIGAEWIDSDDKTIVTSANGYKANITHFCEYMFTIQNAITSTVNTVENVAIEPNFDNTNGSSAIKIGYVEYTQKSGYEWITSPAEAIVTALGAENTALEKIINEAINQTYAGIPVGIRANDKALYPLSLVVPKGTGIRLAAEQKCTETTFTIVVTTNSGDKSIVVKTKQYNETIIKVNQYGAIASDEKQ